MPERFDVVAFLESVDERKIRAELVARLRSNFSRWVGAPRKVFLLGNNYSEQRVWADAAAIMESSLSESEHLFIYFNAPESTKYMVLGLKSRSRVAVYNLSFPTLAIATDMDVVSGILMTMYEEISTMNVRCIVAAGAELEIDATYRSVKDVIRSTKEVGSLIELLCCDRKDAAGLIGFVVVAERPDEIVLSREA